MDNKRYFKPLSSPIEHYDMFMCAYSLPILQDKEFILIVVEVALGEKKFVNILLTGEKFKIFDTGKVENGALDSEDFAYVYFMKNYHSLTQGTVLKKEEVSAVKLRAIMRHLESKWFTQNLFLRDYTESHLELELGHGHEY